MHESSTLKLLLATFAYNILLKLPLKLNQLEAATSLRLFLVRTADTHALHIIRSVYIGCGHSVNTIPHPDWLNNVSLVIKIKVKGHSSRAFQ